MCLQQLAEQNMAVGEGLLCNESIAAVVLEGVAQCCSLSRALCGVEVTGRLDDLAELLVCVGEADVRLLGVHCSELGSEVGFGHTKI